MPRDFIGRTGLKMSELKAKGKPQNPFAKRKARGEDFPDIRETDFFNPKSMAMSRGSHLPKRKAETLPMEFEGVKARAPASKKKAAPAPAKRPSDKRSLRLRATEGTEDEMDFK